jgi:hypothetical protein
MGAALFLGCFLTSLGPAMIVFLLAVAPHANLVVLAILRCPDDSFLPGHGQQTESLLINRRCGAQRILLGVFNVCGVTGVDGCARAVSELICLSPPRRRVTGLALAYHASMIVPVSLDLR